MEMKRSGDAGKADSKCAVYGAKPAAAREARDDSGPGRAIANRQQLQAPSHARR